MSIAPLNKVAPTFVVGQGGLGRQRVIHVGAAAVVLFVFFHLAAEFG